MGDLCLTLLGPPEVRHDDQVLLFSTRKELALLIYLAVVEGGIHLRKNLSEQFWSEGDAMHGRAALRITLLHLRHLLGEGADPVSHFLIQRDTLGLDLTSAIELDLHPLYEAWTLARTSTRSTLTMSEDARRSLLARLQRATGLPRGEFLEGFSLRDAPAFDDWVRFQREYWHLRTSEVFDCLSQMQFEAGELEAAIETVNRWLVLAPLHEDAYGRLMRLHFAAGDRAAALRAYDTCRARLSTGMQTEPTPETVALAGRMRAVAPPHRKEAPASHTHPLALSPATLLDGPLLGRTTELSTLIKLYHSARRGQTQAVLLEGEVGIGKTRLATEFLAWAEMEGADVLQGRAQISLPLEATFTGAFLVKTTNARARGPFKGTLTIGCSFSADRTHVTITRFPPISVGPIRVPVFGLDTVTATKTGGGSGSSTSGTGAMSMRIVLLFHHSLIIRFYPLDSTLSLLMDTGTHTSPSGALRASGSPMDAQGMITFAGVGAFSGGYLAGEEASIVLAGQIAPHP